jgi:hypothetical protein
VQRLGLEDQVDMGKLEKAVELRSGIPTYVMPGQDPAGGIESANLTTPASSDAAASAAESPAPTLPSATVPNAVPASTAEDKAGPANSSVSMPDKNDNLEAPPPAPNVNYDDDE